MLRDPHLKAFTQSSLCVRSNMPSILFLQAFSLLLKLLDRRMSLPKRHKDERPTAFPPSYHQSLSQIEESPLMKEPTAKRAIDVIKEIMTTNSLSKQQKLIRSLRTLFALSHPLTLLKRAYKKNSLLQVIRFLLSSTFWWEYLSVCFSLVILPIIKSR